MFHTARQAVGEHQLCPLLKSSTYACVNTPLCSLAHHRCPQNLSQIKSKPHDASDHVILSRSWNCSMEHVLRFFIPKPKSCWKHTAEFDSMFHVGEGIMSEKHVALTADQSMKTGKKVNWKVKENGRLFYLNESSSFFYMADSSTWISLFYIYTFLP